jgi:protein translocase SecG subunit
MVYFLYAIFFISCIVLVVSVLLQPGKTDAGALFTSNISTSAFNPRGTQSVLAKFSIGAAVVFMLSALFLSLPAFNEGVSVLNSVGETQTETAPAVTDNANINLSTNTNVPVQLPDANNASNAIIVTNANSTVVPAANTNSAPAANQPQGNGNANQ